MRKRTCYSSLRRRADFSRVHARGKRRGDALLQVRVQPCPATVSITGKIRLGIIVSKKYGAAVARNRFKRLVRVAIMECAPEISPGWDILILPRQAQGVKMQEVRNSLYNLLHELGLLQQQPTNEAPEQMTR